MIFKCKIRLRKADDFHEWGCVIFASIESFSTFEIIIKGHGEVNPYHEDDKVCDFTEVFELSWLPVTRSDCVCDAIKGVEVVLSANGDSSRVPLTIMSYHHCFYYVE